MDIGEIELAVDEIVRRYLNRSTDGASDHDDPEFGRRRAGSFNYFNLGEKSGCSSAARFQVDVVLNRFEARDVVAFHVLFLLIDVFWRRLASSVSSGVRGFQNATSAEQL
ncbi:hypothetical protein, partial [Cryobacterium sp. 5B3]|uniref:hypothetical protein n=1 Tax=Cryobacterium sp. 5B3 TaxID=3048586 RepID=UPI002B2309EE